MIITEREFDATESAVDGASHYDPDACEPTLEKMKVVIK